MLQKILDHNAVLLLHSPRVLCVVFRMSMKKTKHTHPRSALDFDFSSPLVRVASMDEKKRKASEIF